MTKEVLVNRPLLHTPLGDYPADAAACYAGGGLHSVMIWPGEQAVVPTAAGEVLTTTGFTLYEDGSLESIEPAQPVPVTTPMGTLPAYDALAQGLRAERYSLQFEPDGCVRGLALSNVSIYAQRDDGQAAWIYPRPAAVLTSPDEEDEPLLLPIRVDIREDAVVVRSGDATALFPAFQTRFTVEGDCSSGGCSGCSGCSGCR